MSKDKFDAIMPIISSDLVSLISKKQDISESEALEQLYSTKLYATLEKEESKVWQYSTEMLYSLFIQEKETGELTFPDV